MARLSVSFFKRAHTWVLCLIGIFVTGLNGQVRMADPTQGGPVLRSTDLAMLETDEVRKDFRCGVTPIQPFRGFDLRLHSGYEVRIPAREVEDQTGILRCMFRVTPEGHPDEPVYFSQLLDMRQADTHAGARIQYGGFDLGPGKYRVDWFIRDARERVCSLHWEVNARDRRETQDGFGLPAGVVQATNAALFDPEPPVLRRQPGALHAMVLVNLAPQEDGKALLADQDLERLLAILRCIAREPRFAKFSLTAFQLNNMRVIFRQRNSGQIDFPGLGQALDSPRLGTVDAKVLVQKHSRTAFLAGLLKETIRSAEKPDILILVSSKAMLNGHILPDTLNLAQPGYPIVYLNYNADPEGNPWQDTIQEAVKLLKGRTYTIVNPPDLEAAWRSVLQIAGARHTGETVASSFGAGQ